MHAFKRSALLFVASLGLALCCAGPPQYLAPEFPVMLGKMYVAPFKNMSTIELAEGFPRDSARIQILFQEIEKAHMELVSEIRLHGKNGGYTVVEKQEFPTIILTPYLMPYKVDGITLSMPVVVKIENRENGSGIKKEYQTKAVYPASVPPQKGSYHFWGIMLGEWRRNFPKEQIAGLFYGKRKG